VLDFRRWRAGRANKKSLGGKTRKKEFLVVVQFRTLNLGQLELSQIWFGKVVACDDKFSQNRGLILYRTPSKGRLERGKGHKKSLYNGGRWDVGFRKKEFDSPIQGK